MKKLVVNDDICIGCGACASIDSSHFEMTDEGLSSVISNENIETDDVKAAINTCPVNAIKLVDDEKDDNCGCGDCKNCAHHEANN